jgi:hypothetical protein
MVTGGAVRAQIDLSHPPGLPLDFSMIYYL